MNSQDRDFLDAKLDVINSSILTLATSIESAYVKKNTVKTSTKKIKRPGLGITVMLFMLLLLFLF